MERRIPIRRQSKREPYKDATKPGHVLIHSFAIASTIVCAIELCPHYSWRWRRIGIRLSI